MKRTKKEVKEKMKSNKAKASGNLVWKDHDTVPCLVCGKLIRQGHLYKVTPCDATHDQKRFYHDKTCGPGTENWKKFKSNGKKVPEVTVDNAEEPQVIPDQTVEPAAPIQSKPKNGNGRQLNPFGHPVGSQAAHIDEMLLAGTTRERVQGEKILWAWFKRHVSHLGGPEHNLKVQEEAGTFQLIQ